MLAWTLRLLLLRTECTCYEEEHAATKLDGRHFLFLAVFLALASSHASFGRTSASVTMLPCLMTAQNTSWKKRKHNSSQKNMHVIPALCFNFAATCAGVCSLASSCLLQKLLFCEKFACGVLLIEHRDVCAQLFDQVVPDMRKLGKRKEEVGLEALLNAACF